MFDLYVKGLCDCFNFSGRAQRSEFWYFHLVNVLVMLALGLLLLIPAYREIGLVVYGLYSLTMVIPTLAICIRRLHDINRSGWFFFITFAPLVGLIIMLIFYCQDSAAGENQWGFNPKFPIPTRAITPAIY